MNRAATARGGDTAPSRSRRAYERLREDIVRGRIAPSEPLFEVHLAEQLGMSRTPVREALKLLAQEGYVQPLPGRGYTVARLTLDDVREFFELREVLEAAAARLAALRASDDELARMRAVCTDYARETDTAAWNRLGSTFHDLIVQASGNRRLQALLGSLHEQIQLSRRPPVQDSLPWRRAVIQDHLDILRAIEARDAAAAHRAASAHVRRSHAAAVDSYQPAWLQPQGDAD